MRPALGLSIDPKQCPFYQDQTMVTKPLRIQALYLTFEALKRISDKLFQNQTININTITDEMRETCFSKCYR
jgi:hypothetical protein